MKLLGQIIAMEAAFRETNNIGVVERRWNKKIEFHNIFHCSSG